MLAHFIMDRSLMLKLIENLGKIEFENRKDVVAIFNALLRKNYSEFATTYIIKTDNGKKTLIILNKGYENSEIALNCGSMIRECIKIPEIHLFILSTSEIITPYFETYLHYPNFDIASDAFLTMKELLTQNKSTVDSYLSPKSDNFKSVYFIII